MTNEKSDEPLLKALWVVLLIWFLLVPWGLTKAGELYVLPKTIRVRITGREECENENFDYVEIIDFKEYIKGVLAGEWGKDWPDDSLKAGAVAVKMYAISAIEENGKWKASPWAQDKVADVYDCDWDQVYQPEWRTKESDRAVDDTWDYLLVSNNTNDPIRTFYNAWYSGCITRGEVGQCMGQWESRTLAQMGIDWRNLLLSYYDNAAIVSLDGSYIQQDTREELNKDIAGVHYEVQPGDSLSSITKRFYGYSHPVFWKVIFKANEYQLKNAYTIKTGQILQIPVYNEIDLERRLFPNGKGVLQ